MAFGMPVAKIVKQPNMRIAEKAGGLTFWHLACQKHFVIFLL